MWRAARTAWHALPTALAAAALHGISATGAAQSEACPAPPLRGTPLATTFPCGLTGPGATDSHFTPALDLEHPLLLQGSGAFMAAARADAQARLLLGAGSTALSPMDAAAVEEEALQHLASASARRLKFMCSSEVPGREETRAALLGHFRNRGQFALLLGGKSTGKSLLLGELAQRRGEIVGAEGAPRFLLYVDARSCGRNLAAGVQAAVERAEYLQKQEHLLDAASVVSAAQQPETHLGTAAAPSVEQCMNLIAQLAALLQRQGHCLCLIVDEANLAFPTPLDTLLRPQAQEQLEDTQRLLQKLVQLTKQSNAMNVLLVCSEHAFPDRLRHGGFFNTANLTEVMFAGEVPPAAMRQLLLHSWGLGPRLADVFLAYYGGHVLMAGQALASLACRLDAFHCECVEPLGLQRDLARSLKGESAEAGGPMTAMLRALAEHGFAPVQRNGGEQVQALALANVGGLVTTSSTVVGLAQGLSGRASYGLVPSSNFVVRVKQAGAFQAPLEGAPPPSGPGPPTSSPLRFATHTRLPLSHPLCFSATSLPRLFTGTRPLQSVHPCQNKSSLSPLHWTGTGIRGYN